MSSIEIIVIAIGMVVIILQILIYWLYIKLIQNNNNEKHEQINDNTPSMTNVIENSHKIYQNKKK